MGTTFGVEPPRLVGESARNQCGFPHGVPSPVRQRGGPHLAHAVTKPPDFDQIVSVEVQDHPLTDEDLRDGIPVTFPGRPNSATHKLTEGEAATGRIGSSDVHLTVGTQHYFETDDLKSAI